jgi:DNA helicase II / ATP-dependent DNA helicase PcrA
MAERLTLEPEVQEILQHIDNGRNFLLSGGAGSGKTYSLVQLINQLIIENPNKKVACMTYTNAAVKEIEERVNHKNLNVSTIHDFLWDNIKHFQAELKATIIALLKDEASKIKAPEDVTVGDSFYNTLSDGIQYEEYLKIKEGIISHDEVLIVANHMYKTYPKLCDILKDKFRFILIDEYQDTSKHVVEILLTHLKQSKKENIIGFFGDAMQAIYEDGIGNLEEYKGDEDDRVREVKKVQNRRNPQSVINLANLLRTDGISQEPSKDVHAPNMQNGIVKKGDTKFYYSRNNLDIDDVKTFIGWNFQDSKKTKILNLTHNLIAPKAGFPKLMDIYDKDPIVKLKNDIVTKSKDSKNTIVIAESDTFEQVVDKFQLKNRQRQLKKDLLLADTTNRGLFDKVKDLPFAEVRKMYLDKDQLIDDKKQDQEDENKKGSKRDDLIKHLFKIQDNLTLYSNGQVNEFIRSTEYKIKSINDKKTLNEQIEKLIKVKNLTIENVIELADEYGLCKKDDKLKRFVSENQYLYDRVKSVDFSEFQKLYNYLEGFTPYSTQHKTKGAEFDNVLVILDNGGWNNYNFNGFFEKNCSESINNRTSKIFYVCCTRVKENLAVYFQNPSALAISTAKEWFGENNVVEVTP